MIDTDDNLDYKAEKNKTGIISDSLINALENFNIWKLFFNS